MPALTIVGFHDFEEHVIGRQVFYEHTQQLTEEKQTGDGRVFGYPSDVRGDGLSGGNRWVEGMVLCLLATS